jgi:hypothetical protein
MNNRVCMNNRVRVTNIVRNKFGEINIENLILSSDHKDHLEDRE